MNRAEDEQKGLMAIEAGGKIIRFARAKYSGELGCFTPDSAVSARDYCAFPTKKAAVEFAKSYGWPASHVDRFGTRFGKAWGIRHDFRDQYFFANYS